MAAPPAGPPIGPVPLTPPEPGQEPPAPAGEAPPTTQPLSRGEVPDSDKPEWMRGLRAPDLPIRWYPKVTRFLETYKTDSRYREIMRGWLKRLPAYRAGMEAALARQGLPRGLVFVAMIESGFSAGALSSRAAGGFWQFRPDVARGYGLEVSFWVDERRDPDKSSAAAATYLGDLYERFGTWELALAGYNAGVNAVLTSINRYNTNDYFTLCQIEAGLPWETTEYVPKVLAAAIVANNPSVFGFDDVVRDEPRPYDVVSAPPGVSFDTLANRLGVTADELAALNPALARRRTPPDRGSIPLRVPRGRTRALTDLRPTDVTLTRVRAGESFARVAKDNKIPRDRLRKLNGVIDEGEVTPGTLILLPRSAKPAARPNAPAKPQSSAGRSRSAPRAGERQRSRHATAARHHTGR